MEGREGRNPPHFIDEETEALRVEPICFQILFLQEEHSIVASEDAGSEGAHMPSLSSLSFLLQCLPLVYAVLKGFSVTPHSFLQL